MGCDIHLFVEKKEDNQWKSVDRWKEETYDDGLKSIYVDYKDEYYSSRNYDLFAILADVRNGYGFAGCNTGDGFNPISDPRGLPSDVSPEVQKASDDYGVDGHSHSFFTVEEILQYDWTQVTKHRGWVNATEFFCWNEYEREHSGPSSYSAGVSGRNIKHITEKEMIEKINKIKEEESKTGKNGWMQDVHKRIELELVDHFCQVEWEESYAQSTKEFWWGTIPKLLHLGDPSQVRIVFFFDN